MKSIIEQASSIMKAIEKAWNQAEQPKEFSIKIFEKEERNFFGMTTKPAKIGIFFGEKPLNNERPTQKTRPEIKECRPEQRDTRPKTTASTTDHTAPKPKQPEVGSNPSLNNKSSKSKIEVHIPKNKPVETSSVHAKPTQPKPQASKPLSDITSENKPRYTPTAWNDTMIATTHHWLKQTLTLMNMPSVEFSSEIAGKNLKLTFSKPLLTDILHEKQLFRSFAHLIMSSLRNQYKQEIKDLKVILISTQAPYQNPMPERDETV